MKIFNYFFAITFLVFAGLQYNDPDPYLWIPIYLVSAILCWQAASGKFYNMGYLICIILFSLYAMYLLFDKTGVLNWAGEHHAENIAQSMKAESPWIEETREFFGLVIVIVVLAINFFRSRK